MVDSTGLRRSCKHSWLTWAVLSLALQAALHVQAQNTRMPSRSNELEWNRNERCRDSDQSTFEVRLSSRRPANGSTRAVAATTRAGYSPKAA